MAPNQDLPSYIGPEARDRGLKDVVIKKFQRVIDT